MKKLNNKCCCYEGYAPFTKNGSCRFCFGLSPYINNKSWTGNREERPIKILQGFNIKQILLNLISNSKP